MGNQLQSFVRKRLTGISLVSESEMKKLVPTLVIASALAFTSARPQNKVLLTTTPQSPTARISDGTEAPPERPPVITQFHVRTDVQFRYAKTVAESYVKNPRCQRLREQIPCDNVQFQALCSVSSGNTEDEVALDEVAPSRPTYPIFPGD